MKSAVFLDHDGVIIRTEFRVGNALGCRTVFVDHGHGEPLSEAPNVGVKSHNAIASVIATLNCIAGRP